MEERDQEEKGRPVIYMHLSFHLFTCCALGSLSIREFVDSFHPNDLRVFSPTITFPTAVSLAIGTFPLCLLPARFLVFFFPQPDS